MGNIRTTRIRTSTVVLVVFGLTVAQLVRVQAQQPMNTDRHTAAQAAAYKALYTCSGLFDAGLTEQRLQDDIFSGIRAHLKQAMVGMRAVVDEKSRTVSVAFADDMPPRVAAWRPHLGCAQLPIGATAEAVQYLPRLPDHVVAPKTDAADWPQGDQNATTILPAAQKAALRSVLDDVFGNETYGGITWGVVVVKDGKIVAERYDRGYDMHTPQRTNSMAKSLAATVIGAAVHQGLLDIHAPAPIAEWQQPGDPRAAITINHLLHMASGLYTERAGNPQSLLYYGGAAATERSAVNIIDSLPGTRWLYAGSDTILTLHALRNVLQDDDRYLAFPFEEVAWKIGMTRTTAETDWNGGFLMSGQLWSTARDFARFGLLYLNDGMWNGERVTPAGWSEYVSTPAPAQPSAGRNADGRRYGAQFWLFGPREGLPGGFYTALGARGQYAMIVPSANMVIVRRGFDRSDGESFRPAPFAADVVSALAPTLGN